MDSNRADLNLSAGTALQITDPDPAIVNPRSASRFASPSRTAEKAGQSSEFPSNGVRRLSSKSTQSSQGSEVGQSAEACLKRHHASRRRVAVARRDLATGTGDTLPESSSSARAGRDS